MTLLLPYRFPRVKQIRHDKIWSDCMTSIDLAALTAPNQGKLTKRFLDTDESAQTQCKVIYSPATLKLNRTIEGSRFLLPFLSPLS